MGKRLPYTPSSRIRNSLRQLFLRSRERAACLKATGNTCERCGIKASQAKGREVKVQVHHREGITSWQRVIDAIRKEILCSPDMMECLCEKCHKEEHANAEAQ
jgi:predicted HNH restriction endonuclease